MDLAGAVRRSRAPLASLALVHLAFLIVGAAMVHAHVGFALERRDRIVADAQASPMLRELDAGHRWRAAGLDFAANLLLAGVPSALSGVTVVFPYGLGAYRAWVGGIVSVDSDHASRLAEPGEAAYYVGVVALQTAGFVLCGAGGVRAGLAWLRPRPMDEGPRLLGVPKLALADMALLVLAAVPFFLAGSIVEFVTLA